MKRPLKILLIFFIIIAFSSSIVNFVAMFYSKHPIYNLAAALFGLAISHIISQDITNKEPETSEEDETFIEN
jgi:hypothetical protein